MLSLSLSTTFYQTLDTHAKKAQTDSQTRCTRTQKDGGLQENHGVNEAAVTHKSPGESVM